MSSGKMPRPSIQDAQNFLQEAKDAFEDKPGVYKGLLKAMLYFKAQRNAKRVVERVQKILQGNKILLQSFERFIPEGLKLSSKHGHVDHGGLEKNLGKLPISKQEHVGFEQAVSCFGLSSKRENTDHDPKVPISKKDNVGFEQAISYVNKVKARFTTEEHVYKAFLGILNSYREGRKAIIDVYKEVQILFYNHKDLLNEFTNFLPVTIEPPAVDDSPVKTSTKFFLLQEEQKYGFVADQAEHQNPVKGELSENDPASTDSEKLQVGISDRREDEHWQLISTEKDREICGKQEQEALGKGLKSGQGNEKISAKQRLSRKCKSATETDDPMCKKSQEIEAGDALEDTFHTIYTDPGVKDLEMLDLQKATDFFKRLRERLRNQVAVERLLCLLRKHIDDHNTLTDLQTKAHDIFERHEDLMKEFDDILVGFKSHEWKLALLIREKDLEEDKEPALKRLKLEENEQNRYCSGGDNRDGKVYSDMAFQSNCNNIDDERKLARTRKEDTDHGRDKQGEDNESNKLTQSLKDDSCLTLSLHHRDKVSYKSISQLDLSQSATCTPSYRLFPNKYRRPISGHQTCLGKEVLNDHWVSVTSGSEDYSFKYTCKNPYEENLFYCEDDRFELDVLIESTGATIKRIEELMARLKHCKDNQGDLKFVNHHLKAIHWRCIERIYDDHGLEMIDTIQRNAAGAFPVVLNRLKQKHNEWLGYRVAMNTIWATVYASNHQKSFDHRSFFFKQQDKISLNTKGLLAEIKKAYEKRMNHDVDFLLMAANGRPTRPDMSLQYLDLDVHRDVCQIIKYSCKELYTKKEQAKKVMRFWKGFFECFLCVQHGINQRKTMDYGMGKREDFSSSPCEVEVDGIKKGSETTCSVSEISASKPKLETSATEGNLFFAMDVLENGHMFIKSFKREADFSYGPIETHLKNKCIAGSSGLPSSKSGGDKVSIEEARRNKGDSVKELGMPDVDDMDQQVAHTAPEETGHESGEGSEDAFESEEEVSSDESDSGFMSLDSGEVEDACEAHKDGWKRERDIEALGFSNDHAHSKGNNKLETSRISVETCKPLAIHITFSDSPPNMRRPGSVFYGNADFYILFKLHEVLYNRILFAKQIANIATQGDSCQNPYTQFMQVLFDLVHGSIDNEKYEDICQSIFGIRSYVLITLDKLIFKIVKQMQCLIADNQAKNLLELHLYEALRTGGFVDEAYCANAESLMPDEDIYRFEKISNTNEVHIHIIDSHAGKHVMQSSVVDSCFFLYSRNFAFTSQESKGCKVFLSRNIQRPTDNEPSMMDAVHISNGLQISISRQTHKTSYVLNTEDCLHHRRKYPISPDVSSAVYNRADRNILGVSKRISQKHVQKFHRWIDKKIKSE